METRDSLKQEVHFGWSEKAAAVMGSPIAATTIAAGRAMADPAMQEPLGNIVTNPEVAVPAIATATISLGVAAEKETLKESTIGPENGFSGLMTTSKVRDEKEAAENISGLLSW